MLCLNRTSSLYKNKHCCFANTRQKRDPAGSPVWDGQASVHSPLQSTEHLVACGGSGEPGVQVAGESSRFTVDALHVELVTRHLHLAFVHLIQAELGQKLPRETTGLKPRFRADF